MINFCCYFLKQQITNAFVTKETLNGPHVIVIIIFIIIIIMKTTKHPVFGQSIIVAAKCCLIKCLQNKVKLNTKVRRGYLKNKTKTSEKN